MRIALFMTFLTTILTPDLSVAQSTCSDYGSGSRLGGLENITESSGAIVSHLNQDVIWTHNDSGADPSVYAVDFTGQQLLTVNITGATAIDWEDMDIGPCVVEGCSCLYFADVGDNSETRGGGTIYRVVEPQVASFASGQVVEMPVARALTFEYPDGPHNSETLFIDPHTGIPYIVTKSDSGEAIVFRFPEANPSTLPVTLERVAEMDFTGQGPLGRPTTGGNVSGDGGRLVIRTYKEAWEWAVDGDDFDATFDSEPLQIKLPRRMQGEAISYSADGAGLVITTEGDIGMMDYIPCTAGSPTHSAVQSLRTFCSDSPELP